MPEESGQCLELCECEWASRKDFLLLEPGGKEAGGRALTGQWLWGWADRQVKSRSMSWVRSGVVPGIAACGTLGKLHHASGPLFPGTVRWGNASFPALLVPGTVILRTRCYRGRDRAGLLGDLRVSSSGQSEAFNQGL